MTNDSAPPLPRGWLVVALLWFVAAFNYLDRGMLTTMHASIVSAIPMTEAQFGLLTSIFLWVYGVLSPLAGFLADRVGRSRVIILSMIVFSACTFLTGCCRTFPQLFFMRAAMGISEACYIPAALALISDYHPGATRSFAMGVHLTGVGVGGGLGGLGGWIADRHGWHTPFLFFGVLGAAYGLILLFTLRDVPRAGSETVSAPSVLFGPALASLFSRRGFILTFSFYGLVGLSSWVGTGWLPTYFQEHFHLRQGQSGFYTTGLSRAGNFTAYLISGLVSDWASRHFRRGRIIVSGIALLVVAPAGLVVANTGILAWALVGIAWGGFFGAFVDPNLMPIICMVTDRRYRATAYGILNFFACIIGGIGIYAGGALSDIHIGLNYVLMFPTLTLVLAAVLLLSIRPQPEEDPIPEGGAVPAPAK